MVAEKMAADTAIKKIKQDSEREAKLLTEQLLKLLSMSESKKSASKRKPAELIAMLSEQQASSEHKVTQLLQTVQKQHEEKEEELAALRQGFEEERRKEEDKVMTFALKLEERDETVLRQISAHMDTGQLTDVVARLYREHDIRLTGVACGLSFLMEAPMSQWARVVEKQLEIQAALSQLLPEDARKTMNWATVTPMQSADTRDIDIQLGKHINVRSMLVTPQQLFSCKLETDSDRYYNFIVSTTCTAQGIVVVADYSNKKLKTVDTNTSQSEVSVSDSFSLSKHPYRLALLNNQLVAVTVEGKAIYFLTLEHASLSLHSQITTVKQYYAMCGNTDDTIIVSTDPNYTTLQDPMFLDIISLTGQVVKSINIRHSLPQILRADYLCRTGNILLVSDWRKQSDSNIIHKLSLVEENITEAGIFKHENLRPYQACVDEAGNIYVASEGNKNVMVVSPSGQWRSLVTAQDAKDGYIWPRAVCITNTGVLAVSWSKNPLSQSRLMAYKLW
jgi:hypothetical protein